jgi:hypothetical protein
MPDAGDSGGNGTRMDLVNGSADLSHPSVMPVRVSS